MRDIEIDFVVKDSLAALKCYERIFDVERIEVTDLKTGENEVVFSIHGTKFHLLDENSLSFKSTGIGSSNFNVDKCHRSRYKRNV